VQTVLEQNTNLHMYCIYYVNKMVMYAKYRQFYVQKHVKEFSCCRILQLIFTNVTNINNITTIIII